MLTQIKEKLKVTDLFSIFKDFLSFKPLVSHGILINYVNLKQLIIQYSNEVFLKTTNPMKY